MEVIFEEEAPIARALPKVRKPSLLSRMVMATGLAKTMAQAEQVMLIGAICALVLAVAIVLIGNQPPPQQTQSQVQAQLARFQAEENTSK
jgi:hypothetical protein